MGRSIKAPTAELRPVDLEIRLMHVVTARMRPAGCVPRARIALAIALMIGTGLPVVAQEALSPRDVARLRRVAAAAIAPGGDAVAFVRIVPRIPLDEQDGAARAELHLVTPDGRERSFVTGDMSVASVTWTPDGSGISFLSRRATDDFRSLYVIPRDGGEARKVVGHGSNILRYAWSPDGQRLAFLATDPVSGAERELERKGFKQIVYEESARSVRVWVTDVTAEESTSDARALDLPGSASTLRWSPTDSRLAFMLAPTPLIDDDYMRKKLHVVNTDTGGIVARIDNPGKIGDVAWSPDGTHLAVIAASDLDDPLEGRLMVVPAAGGHLVDTLAGWDDGHVSAIAWRDETTLMFLAEEGVGSFLGTVGRDGTAFEKLLAPATVALAPLTLSKDGGRAAVLGMSPEHPTEVFLVEPGASGLRRLTDSNPWLNERMLAPQEIVRFQARDGLDLEGLLIRPLHEEAGTRYPLIVVAHGGPEAHYPHGWLTSYSMPGQVAAGRGFAVFYPNYRGSTGRGVEFSKLSQGDPAGKEFDDLVDGVDHLIETGLATRDRVGITGGSYGGYASAWGATYYSDRFAASVMFVGISNNLSKTGTSDIPNELYLVHHRKWVWEDWNEFLQRSPVYHVDKARTPLLILHGTEDTRVHPGQSLELYRHFKLRAEAPVRLILYPGEGHGNRRAAARFDYNLRMMRWMEHYLQGPGGPPPPYTLTYEEEPAPTTTSPN